MSAEDRRQQLVEIGLDLLRSRPIHEMALDEVAAAAGISRSLLFHYFPTKSDYYASVVESAGRRMLLSAGEPRGDDPRARVRVLVAGYLRLVARSRPAYVALVRGASGGDPKVLLLLEEIRTSLVAKWLTSAGEAEPSALMSLIVRGWLASLEEIALVPRPRVPQEALIDHLTEGFFVELDRCRAADSAPSIASTGAGSVNQLGRTGPI